MACDAILPLLSYIRPDNIDRSHSCPRRADKNAKAPSGRRPRTGIGISQKHHCCDIESARPDNIGKVEIPREHLRPVDARAGIALVEQAPRKRYVPSDLIWLTPVPLPLELCPFNASAMPKAVTLVASDSSLWPLSARQFGAEGRSIVDFSTDSKPKDHSIV